MNFSFAEWRPDKCRPTGDHLQISGRAVTCPNGEAKVVEDKEALDKHLNEKLDNLDRGLECLVEVQAEEIHKVEAKEPQIQQLMVKK